jgi:ABC-2 type transport system permease protein
VRAIIRAAYVIGRRDFNAIIYSKAFIFFLLGPLFPLLIGVAAGSLGGQIAKDIARPVIGVALSGDEGEKLLAARTTLAKEMGEREFPELKIVAQNAGSDPLEPKQFLQDGKGGFVAIISGSLAEPVMTGTRSQVEGWRGAISLLASYAASGQAINLPKVETDIVRKSAGNAKQQRLITAQAAQTLLFLLTMLLAGMVLSNLVEEKSNKIIEILAASIPMESVFLGKLFAMLAMACVGIIVWATVGIAVLSIWGPGLPNLPTPAVGWPIFMTLGVVYFALAYLMLGSLFLGIGAMAATVREVQTLSMPATMAQLLIFFLSMFTVTKIGEPVEQFASIFPFSSPYAMIARASQESVLWHHGVAIIGQIAFATLLLRVGVALFKRNVMKSGSGGRIKDEGTRKLFGLVKVRS